MSLQNLRTRKATVENVGKITKAMEVVSATKMRKSQEVALKTRPYAIAALELLRTVTRFVPVDTVYTRTSENKKTLIVMVASDRGLTGAFNAQVLREAEKYFKETKTELEVLAVGKKASQFAEKNALKIVKSFSGYGDAISYDEVSPLAEFVIDGFAKGKWGRVITISTHFRTTLKQEVLVREVLPASTEKIEAAIDEIVPEHGKYKELDPLEAVLTHNDDIEYILEPSAEKIAESLIPYLIRMQLYHLMLEANASEHSARRVAMKTATDNAHELRDDLTLLYNKARQAAITKEIIEITSTQMALG
ncbi:MAG: ATP synthase F1 subunit gamma [bacterium]|nr:ATP synthase F1 subunit gamma [bacterium]